MAFNGTFDEDEVAFFRVCMRAGGSVVDIGANVGLITVRLGRALIGGSRILAIEPVESNARALELNIALNGLAEVCDIVRCALGREEGRTWIGRETGCGASTGNAYTVSSASSVNIRTLDWSEVPVETVDRVISEWDPDAISLIKIDVEGQEYSVLAGGVRVLARYRPIIYGEFQLSLAPDGPTMADVEKLLENLDYRLFAFEDRLRLVEVPFAVGRGNAVLIPREKVAATLDVCTELRSGTRAAGTRMLA
jgi:FkbM family methyltransferase